MAADLAMKEVMNLCVSCVKMERSDATFECEGPNCVFVKVFKTPSSQLLFGPLARSYGVHYLAKKLKSFLSDPTSESCVEAALLWAKKEVGELNESSEDGTLIHEAKSVIGLARSMVINVMPTRVSLSSNNELRMLLSLLAADLKHLIVDGSGPADAPAVDGPLLEPAVEAIAGGPPVEPAIDAIVGGPPVDAAGPPLVEELVVGPVAVVTNPIVAVPLAGSNANIAAVNQVFDAITQVGRAYQAHLANIANPVMALPPARPNANVAAVNQVFDAIRQVGRAYQVHLANIANPIVALPPARPNANVTAVNQVYDAIRQVGRAYQVHLANIANPVVVLPPARPNVNVTAANQVFDAIRQVGRAYQVHLANIANPVVAVPPAPPAGPIANVVAGMQVFDAIRQVGRAYQVHLADNAAQAQAVAAADAVANAQILLTNAQVLLGHAAAQEEDEGGTDDP